MGNEDAPSVFIFSRMSSNVFFIHAPHSPCSFIAVDLPVDGLQKALIFHWKDKAFLAKVQCFLMKFQNELGWPGISRLSMLEISPVSIF